MVDRRIPADWYYNRLCFTGDRLPAVEVARAIYEYLGDPTNELERFTNPVAYHEKRGGWYDPETDIVTYMRR